MTLTLSLDQQLAVRHALEQYADQIIDLVYHVAGQTDLRGNSELTRTQINQLHNVALQMASVPPIVEWINYQAGRESTTPAWSYNNLSSILVARLGSSNDAPAEERDFYTIRDMAQWAVGDYDALDDSHLALLWLKLARLFIGYFRWHALVIFKERGDE